MNSDECSAAQSTTETLDAAGRWFLHSGIQDPSGGVARYYRCDLGKNARVSTEITGYAVSALLFFHLRSGQTEYLEAALRAARFLTRTAWNPQLGTFPFEHSANGDRPAALAYFFDTGIIIRGLLAAWRVSQQPEFRDTAIAAGRAMLTDFRTSDGIHPVLALPHKRPLDHESNWSAAPGCYQLKSAMAIAAGARSAQFRYGNIQELPHLAVALGLHFGSNNLIRCWHPENHQNGDRTASVSINKQFNVLKCHGPCYRKPLGPINLVADVLGLDAAQATSWIAARFQVPLLPKGKHLKSRRLTVPRAYGSETAVELLVQSGVWAKLSAAAKVLLPAMVTFGKKRQGDSALEVSMSYCAMERYAGLSSRSIAKGLRELAAIGLLRRIGPGGLVAGKFLLMPDDDALRELCNLSAGQNAIEVAAQRELRRTRRRTALDKWAEDRRKIRTQC